MGQWLIREGTVARSSDESYIKAPTLKPDSGASGTNDPRKYNFVLQATVDGGGTWDVFGLGPAGTYTQLNASSLSTGDIYVINTGMYAAVRVDYTGGTDGGSSLAFWASPKFNNAIA